MDELGGAQIHVRDLASAAVRRGWQATIVTGSTGSASAAAEHAGCRVVAVPSLRRSIGLRSDRRAIDDVTTVLQELEADVVSCHSSKAGVVGRLAARRTGTPVVFTAHGWSFTSGVPPARRVVYALFEIAVARLADRIICVSGNDFRLAQRVLPHVRKRIVLIRNGMPDVPPALRADPAATVDVVFVGRFGPQKDHETALRAFAAWATRNGRLRFIGAGDAAPLQRIASDLGVDDRVDFLGERSDVAELMARAGVYLLTSNWEGLPRSVIEAMRAGLPVVATDVGGTAELVESGTNGILVARADVASVVDALRQLAEPTLRRQLGTAGRRRYEEYFTFERLEDETFALLESVALERTS